MEDKRTITREVRTNMLYVGRTENKSMDRWFRPEGPGCSSGSRLHQRCFTFVVISESSVISQFLSKFASDGGCSRGGAGRSHFPTGAPPSASEGPGKTHKHSLVLGSHFCSFAFRTVCLSRQPPDLLVPSSRGAPGWTRRAGCSWRLALSLAAGPECLLETAVCHRGNYILKQVKDRKCSSPSLVRLSTR